MGAENNCPIPKVGMRIIKTAISVFIVLLIFAVLDIPYSFYGCIAAVICMQPTVDKTYKSGRDRIIGTILGGMIGFVFLECILHLPGNERINQLIIIPFGIVGIIYLCNLLKIPGTVSISCIVLLNIILNMDTRGVGDSFMYAVYRVLETLVGIVSAMLVNRWFIIPKWLEKYLPPFVKVENDVQEQ